MDQPSLTARLADLPLPDIRYFSRIDSTNDEAWRWVERQAPHGALVIADEQTAGRGRLQHHWVTVPQSSLAFSLVLHSPPLDTKCLTLLSGLGALAACQTLDALYSLPALVKWPNDILLDQRKAGGVLVEARWNGTDLSTVVVGIGINIAPESIDTQFLSAAGLSVPATCVENLLGQTVDRIELLHGILHELFSWLPQLDSPDFIHAWESCLAYRDQWVEITTEPRPQPYESRAVLPDKTAGKVIGLGTDGSLRLLTASGELAVVQVGEIHLRPAPPPTG